MGFFDKLYEQLESATDKASSTVMGALTPKAPFPVPAAASKAMAGLQQGAKDKAQELQRQTAGRVVSAVGAKVTGIPGTIEAAVDNRIAAAGSKVDRGLTKAGDKAGVSAKQLVAGKPKPAAVTPAVTPAVPAATDDSKDVTAPVVAGRARSNAVTSQPAGVPAASGRARSNAVTSRPAAAPDAAVAEQDDEKIIPPWLFGEDGPDAGQAPAADAAPAAAQAEASDRAAAPAAATPTAKAEAPAEVAPAEVKAETEEEVDEPGPDVAAQAAAARAGRRSGAAFVPDAEPDAEPDSDETKADTEPPAVADLAADADPDGLPAALAHDDDFGTEPEAGPQTAAEDKEEQERRAALDKDDEDKDDSGAKVADEELTEAAIGAMFLPTKEEELAAKGKGGATTEGETAKGMDKDEAKDRIKARKEFRKKILQINNELKFTLGGGLAIAEGDAVKSKDPWIAYMFASAKFKKKIAVRDLKLELDGLKPEDKKDDTPPAGTGADADTDGKDEDEKLAADDLDAPAKTAITVKDGLLFRSGEGDMEPEAADTTEKKFEPKNNRQLFAADHEHNIHLALHEISGGDHSKLLPRNKTAVAGEIEIRQGRIVHLSNNQAGDRESRDALMQLLMSLRANQVAMTFDVFEAEKKSRTKADKLLAEADAAAAAETGGKLIDTMKQDSGWSKLTDDYSEQALLAVAKQEKWTIAGGDIVDPEKNPVDVGAARALLAKHVAKDPETESERLKAAAPAG